MSLRLKYINKYKTKIEQFENQSSSSAYNI